ncbi:MAG: GAF domain-containing protein [Xanthomonadales bacterium]|nr:GAF domain-containing protein [Xanthomonadales bacterium]
MGAVDPTAARLPLGSGAATLVERSLAALARLTGYDVAYLTVVDEERGVQQVLLAHRRGGLDTPPGLTVPWRETLCRRAFEAGTLGCREVAESFPDAEAAIALGIRGYAMAPIRIAGRFEGTLCLASREPLALDPRHREVLEVFAELISAQLARELALAELLHAQGELARGPHRFPHRAAQPVRPSRRALAPPAAATWGCAAVLRLRGCERLQGDQRSPWPRRGRPLPDRGRPPPARGRARRRDGGALRR